MNEFPRITASIGLGSLLVLALSGFAAAAEPRGLPSSAQGRKPIEVTSATDAEPTPPAASDEPPPESEAILQAPPETPPAPPPPPPKKPTPPVFPGPKTLPGTGPWKVLYFDNDFSYKNDPQHERLFGEELKDLKSEVFGVPLKFSTGGEVRYRFMNEDNRLRPGGPAQSEYNLWRWRHYVDMQYGDFRVYGEGIEAESFGSNSPDQAIDVNQWDIQNLFADYTFLRSDLGTHTLRYGRQELLFGRQRLISPLDWGNTRRNFEGLRYMLKGEDFKLDLFSTHPVNSATGFQPVQFYGNHFDKPRDEVWFSGAYLTYTGYQNTVIDAYWLWLDTGDRPDVLRPDGQRHLFGSRYARLFPSDDGSRVWDLDTEGGLQTGRDNGRDVLAGFYTYVVGHTWKNATFTPRLSHLFYYGSGQSGSSRTNNTFNTYFPLGHAYWALSDNLAGQNLLDYSIQGDIKPTKKSTFTTAYHWLDLASSNDRAYNVAGVPTGRPGNGRDLGTALDLYGSYAFNPNFDVQAGYSWFWYGNFIESQPELKRGDATQFYLQASLRY